MVQALHRAVQINDQQHRPCLEVLIVPGRAAEETASVMLLTSQSGAWGRPRKEGHLAQLLWGKGCGKASRVLCWS